MNSLPTTTETPAFADFNLPHTLLKSLEELGYESPSPIQAASIPILLKGRDLLGQAQTGTGKTAAFALPLLARLDKNNPNPQILVLAPTRELAIQVAEAFQRYARNMDFRVLPIYGGQSYTVQLNQLRRGSQIIVGTPGRVMDHIRRKSLVLDNLQTLVLDEADEMLRMGFIDDVEWILEHTPKERQIALFSATMPKEIRKVANTYLRDAEHIKIATKTSTASTIHQRFILINHRQKLDAFTRIMEIEDFDGVIIFVRTKIATVELADKLGARGYRCQALNGDMAQAQREQMVEKFKRGRYDFLVATDVVARGLDIDRISHVINYDIPLDTESYVHRIGRTGRAGRSGEAILFVAPRERRLLHAIEKATKSAIEPMRIPSADVINEKRVSKFSKKILETISEQDLSKYHQFLANFQQENDYDPSTIAAAIAWLHHGGDDLFAEEMSIDSDRPERGDKQSYQRNSNGRDKNSRSKRDRHLQKPLSKDAKRSRRHSGNPIDMESYRLEVGHNHGVKPGNIVGAIANEADIESRHIGHIKINSDFSTVDLPSGMPKSTLLKLKKTYVCGKPIDIKVV